ncbi:MAG TPA: tryptophan-rich sensory protein [Hyphomicrobium sp.]|nr:tryptophan-rich sensory protein [Hyphomicrobium sp.]
MTDNTRDARPIAAALFIIAVVAISMLIGYITQPGPWYASLAKPSFNPPGWVFGPVWTVLYMLIALAGWRIWRAAPSSTAMWLWIAQMILNWFWSPAFFGLNAPWLAFALIVCMLATIVAFIVQARKYDRLAAALFVPYLAWVSFATVLNGSIAAMN